MNKLGKIIKTLFVFILMIVFSVVKAASIPVENIFNDIDKNYKYYNELQTLYDKGMIFPDSDGEFKAESFLTRAEFVGIASEVSCKRCIQPNTEMYFIDKYKVPPFFDVLRKNKYFYCIADAKANNFVAGYANNFKCDDGTYKKDDKPFCVNNYITREEALAVILRMSGILTAQQAEEIRQQIRNGANFSDLAIDVKPRLEDGRVYSFYPDFQKALDYEVVDVDLNGNTQVLKLIEKQNNYLYPHKDITKQDFLKMAYVALKANNSCIQLDENALALQIQIFDKQCSENKIRTCDLSDLEDSDNTFDFNSEVKGVCEKGVDSENGYIWRFYNESTGEQFIKKGKYIDNYKFLSPGKWLIFLVVKDNCGNTGETKNTIFIKDDNAGGDDGNSDMGLMIKGDPLTGYGPLDVNLEGIVAGGVGPYKYEWDFGDGTTGEGENIKHTFIPGTYEVKLVVTDSNGEKADSVVTVNVNKIDSGTGTGTEVEDGGDGGDLDMGLMIIGDPLSGYGPLDVNLEGIVDGGVGPYKYEWDFGDGTTGEGENTRHTFVPGTYKIKLKVIDSDGDVVESNIDVNVMQPEYLDVSIDANPIIGPGPLEVDLSSLVNGSNGPFDYSWDFGDGTTGEGENIKHVFNNKGVYEVVLTVTDDTGRTGIATVLIKVTDDINCETDSDGDGVNNCLDKCIFVKGESINSGCPVFDKHCKADCSCDEGYVCGDNNPQTCSSGICTPKPIILSSCLNEYKTKFTGITFGNAVCNTCPCENNRFLDFVSALRFCDTVFPAITSPDERKIYKRGNVFQIK